MKDFIEKTYERLEKNRISGWIPYIKNYPSDNPTVEIFRNLGDTPKLIENQMSEMIGPDMIEVMVGSEMIGEITASFEQVDFEGTPCVRMSLIKRIILKKNGLEFPFYESPPTLFEDYLKLEGGYFKVYEVLSEMAKTIQPV
ncbi:MAG: hypothetical protein GOU97_04840 [Nanoarchaeota archaeon]|nr:hypothetical protein [Nanoarchaeota archaeon]